MRPRELLRLVQKNQPGLSPPMEIVTPDKEMWKISNVRELVRALIDLEQASAFRTQITHLRLTIPILFESAGDFVFLPSQQRGVLFNKLKELDQQAIIAQNLLFDWVGAENPLEVSVRLPSDIGSPSQLQDDIGTFVTALDQIPRRLGLGGVTFDRVDVGSSWILFIAENLDVLALVIGLTSVVLKLVDRNKQNQVVLQSLAGMAVHQSVQAELAASIKSLRETLVDETLKRVDRAIDPADRNEAIALISVNLDKLASMYERGATIMLSAAAPKDLAAKAPVEMNTVQELKQLTTSALTRGKGDAEPR